MENHNHLKEDLIIIESTKVQREYYDEYEGYLKQQGGRQQPVRTMKFHDDSNDEDTIRFFIPWFMLVGNPFTYILNYKGIGEYKGYSHHVFDSYRISLKRFPLDTIVKVKTQTVNEKEVPMSFGDITEFTLSSVENALKELQQRGICHGEVCPENVVIVCNGPEISDVKLKGAIDRGVELWRNDFVGYGKIVNCFLSEFPNYPEGSDFARRFDGSDRIGNKKMLFAYFEDPLNVRKHPARWNGVRSVNFFCKLYDYVDAYHKRERNIKASDKRLYNRITNITITDWKSALPRECKAEAMERLNDYSSTRSIHFLAFIRHFCQHSATSDTLIQKHFGVTGEGYYRTFRGLNQRFLIQCFTAVEEEFNGTSGLVYHDFFDDYLILPSAVVADLL